MVTALEPSAVGGAGGRILKRAPRTWIERGTRDLNHTQRTLQHQAFLDLPYIVTTNAAYTREALDAAGNFDESFRSGGDVDLAWRVLLAGYSLVAAPRAVVYHSSRDTVQGYFRQYATYGTGQVQLFKKYRSLAGRRAFVHPYAAQAIRYAQHQASTVLLDSPRRWPGSRATLRQLWLETVASTAMLSGYLRGSARFEVCYL